MDCKSFKESIAAFISEKIDEAQRSACETHMIACAECLDLWLSKVDAARIEYNESEHLLSAILLSTAVNVCEESEKLLCDYVDESLDAQSMEMLTQHLTHCESCHDTVSALRVLKFDLPKLARRSAPPELVDNVLWQTLSLQQYLLRKINFTLPKLTQIIYRPRFSLEASFLGTFLWLAVFGVPTAVPTFADSEPAVIQTVSQKTSQVQRRIIRIRINFEIDLNNLQPLLEDEITALGNSTSILLRSGISRARRDGSELLQKLGREMESGQSFKPIEF